MTLTDNNDVHFALVDADTIYFRICCVTYKKFEIRRMLKAELEQIRRQVQFFDEKVVLRIAIKGEGNFRYLVDPEYKKNRPPMEAEMIKALAYAQEHLVEAWDAVRADGMEADDVVSIWAKECSEEGLDYTVVHVDKDLDMIPGRHYNFKKQLLYKVAVKEAWHNFMTQCLMGDAVDGIKGVRGIGKVKALKILQPLYGKGDKQFKAVQDTWKEQYPEDWEERLWKDSTLLRMLTSWDDVDLIKKQLEEEDYTCREDIWSQPVTEEEAPKEEETELE